MFNPQILAYSVYFFWSFKTIKLVLFWIYLWQLKSYHFGRFIDHFRTYKGKLLIFNPLLAIKLLLLVTLYFWPISAWALLLVYFVESIQFLRSLVKNRFKKPVFTAKAMMLLAVTLILFLVSGWIMLLPWKLLWLDVLTPLIVSIVVLLIEPVFVVLRNRTLKRAREKLMRYKHLKVIGVTGSYGKTSTKEFLTTILSSQFNVLATPEHKNSEMGIAQTILENLNGKHEIFIVEMGAYNKGGIKLLCDMVQPSIGIVTGVNQQHLSTFGSMKNLLSAEGGGELADALKEKGLLVVNGNNKHCVDLYKNFSGRKKMYSTQHDVLMGDLWTEDISVKEYGVSFVTVSKEKYLQSFWVPVLGKQQIQNLLGAILVAKELGMSFEKISESAKTIRQSQGGMTLKKGVHGIFLIDSSYSSNPDGVIADLDYLSVFSGNPSTSLRVKKVVVMPCLIELGKDAKQVHTMIGKKIAQVCDLAIIASRDYFSALQEGALTEGMKAEQILLCDNPVELYQLITTHCKSGDVVLLEGRVPEKTIHLLEDVKK